MLEKWKCEFAQEKREMHNFLENHPILINPPLDPHVLWWPENIETNIVMGMEKIHYVDVCSLYPYVMKTGTFPLSLQFISEKNVRS